MLEWHSAYRTRRLFAILKEMLIAVSGDGPLAQLAEHRTFNPGVVGSIPTRPTNFRHKNRPLDCSRGFALANLPTLLSLDLWTVISGYQGLMIEARDAQVTIRT